MSDDLFANCRDEKAKPIVTALIEDILAAGHSISVNDDFQGDGEWVVNRSRNMNEIFSAFCSTEGDLVDVYNKDGECFGWVSLIWCNGREVISNSSGDFPEELTRRADDLVDKLMDEDYEKQRATDKI